MLSEPTPLSEEDGPQKTYLMGAMLVLNFPLSPFVTKGFRHNREQNAVWC